MSLYLAFLTGLLASLHCTGMCGGIMAAFGQTLVIRSPLENQKHLLVLNLGRITLYALMGGVFGWAGSSLNILLDYNDWAGILRRMTALMIILLGFQLLFNKRLSWLEQITRPLWRRLQPLFSPLLPARHYWQSATLGFLWGFLPCGLVWSMWIIAMGGASTVDGMLLLASFGLGTLPALLLTGSVFIHFRQFLKAETMRFAAAFVLCLAGIWLWTAPSLASHDHSQHFLQNALLNDRFLCE